MKLTQFALLFLLLTNDSFAIFYPAGTYQHPASDIRFTIAEDGQVTTTLALNGNPVYFPWSLRPYLNRFITRGCFDVDGPSGPCTCVHVSLDIEYLPAEKTLDVQFSSPTSIFQCQGVGEELTHWTLSKS